MSSSEFGLWLEFMHEEGLGPAGEQQQWAQLMAALWNGPMTRKGGRIWTGADFLPQPWRKPEAAKPATGASALAFARKLKQQRKR